MQGRECKHMLSGCAMRRFAEVMGLMGADVRWQPHSITISGTPVEALITSSGYPVLKHMLQCTRWPVCT